VRNALDSFELTEVRVIIIENIGNLVCPSGFDLGEDAKVAVVSLPEGDEKPVKYPNLFMRAEAVIVNKIDLSDILEYDISRIRKDCARLNSNVKIFELSAKTGEGMEEWISYLTEDKLG
jgi:hydrogenase nickel incorporation protein HypB